MSDEEEVMYPIDDVLAALQHAEGRVRPNASEDGLISLSAIVWTAGVTASSAASLSCQNAGKAQKFAPVRGSYGNPGSEACELR